MGAEVLGKRGVVSTKVVLDTKKDLICGLSRDELEWMVSRIGLDNVEKSPCCTFRDSDGELGSDVFF